MHNFNHKQNFKTKKGMKNKILCLFVMFFIFIPISESQILSNTESSRTFNMYKSVITKSDLTGEDVILVRLSRPLTVMEIERLKPLRSFSIDHYMIREKYVQQLAAIVLAQERANMLWKASEKLTRLHEQTINMDNVLTIRLSFNQLSQEITPLIKSFKTYRIDYQNSIITAAIQMSTLMRILTNEAVLFADVIQPAREDVAVNGLDLSTNEISSARQRYPEINGRGITVSLKEGMFDRGDIDISANITSLPAALPALTGHATIMATLILGRGNTFIKGLGVAPFAKLTSSDFSNLMPDDIKQLNALKVNVQNHSYGTDLDNIYGIEAAAYDKQIFEADTLIHVFSAGNKGTATPQSGIYTHVTNTANLTGNFKQAKNVIIVGGINRENIAESLSSRGPGYDGRVKPEVVALGEDGTSGAAALTTGVVALMQQEYKVLYGKQPAAALVKSILVNSADDLGTPQVDFVTGFGKVNALEGIQTIIENRFKTASIGQQEEYKFQLQVPAGQKKIKVTLAWTDPPAAINSVISIVNHLDLSLETPTGQIILPWVLSSYPNADSLALPATRKIDAINTVQQLSLENITAGNYIIHVKGRKVQQQKQEFAIAYQLTAANQFYWTFPENNDAVFAGKENYLRWSNSYSAQHGKLSISYDNGINWLVLSNDINLDASFYKWNTPALFNPAILKMEISGKEYLSKSFTISSPPFLNVGYNCENKLLLHWKPQQAATGYTLFNLKDNALTKIIAVTDTLVELDKSTLSSSYLAISANGQDFNGMKSYTIDYTTQGVSCYVRSFIGNINGDAIQLDLSLGSIYNLKSLIWEKQTTAGQFMRLAETGIISGQLNYSLTDNHPGFGPQFYRVTFITTDGLQVHTDLLKINFLKEADFVTYPNPVVDYLSIVSGDFDPYSFSLFNLSGQKVLDENGAGAKQVKVSTLLPGIYIGLISRKGVVLKRIKIIKNSK